MRDDELSHLVHLASILNNVGFEGVYELAPLLSGLSNRNYVFKANFGGSKRIKRFVLRENLPHSSGLRQREHEVNNWRQVEKIGKAPTLVWVSDDYRFYVSQFISEPIKPWHTLSQENLANMSFGSGSNISNSPCLKDIDAPIKKPELKLVELLKCLIYLPKPDNKVSVTEQWHIYSQNLVSMSNFAVRGESNDCENFQLAWQGLYHRLLKENQRIEQWLAQLEACLIRPQFCHRDLNPHNLLLDSDKLLCIDFEYACNSHPLFDLAGVLCTHSLNRYQQVFLVEKYLADHPNLSQQAIAALPAAMSLYWVFAATWALQMLPPDGVEQGKSIDLSWCEHYLQLAGF